jgi:hypothetical protein
MRQLVICSFTLLIGLPAVARCQDAEQVCPYAGKCRLQVRICCQKAEKCGQDAKKCCAEATACQDKATACECEAAACQTEQSACPCKAAARVADATACQAESAACEKGHVACAGCSSNEKIKHLEKAAEHLQAAGLESEAEHVLAAAHALCNDLLAQKIAELERLQAEIHALERTAAQLKPPTTRK